MMDRRLIRVAYLTAGLMLASGGIAVAQQTDLPPGAAAPAAPAPAQTFSQQQLDQMLAPIALYPDSLLSQVLMASTYPLEVVEADRWVKANPGLTGDPLATQLEAQQWDPSVKSLVNFPQVLAMMSDKLDWTTQLGDAFLAQQQAVSDTIQNLRAKAQAAGNLQTTPQQQVVMDNSAGPPVIDIEPANPDVVYVPTYDPNLIYGPWWYPDAPPYYWYPPGYVHRPGIWWGPECRFGVAWGYAWGAWDWHHHDVVIDFHRNENFNNHIDRDRYRTVFVKHDPDFHGNVGAWQHDPEHRRGVWYRDPGTAAKFNAPDRFKGANDREAYRGREIQSPPSKVPDVRNNPPLDAHRDAPPRAEAPRVEQPPKAEPPRIETPTHEPVREAPRAPVAPAPTDSRNNGMFGDMDRGSAVRNESQRGSDSRSGGGASRSPAPTPAPSGGGGGGARNDGGGGGGGNSGGGGGGGGGSGGHSGGGGGGGGGGRNH